MSDENKRLFKGLENIVNTVMGVFLKNPKMSYVKFKKLIDEEVTDFNSVNKIESDELLTDDQHLTEDMFLTYTVGEGDNAVTYYKEDKEEPKLFVTKKLNVLIVYGKILNILCDLYLKNVGLKDPSSLNNIRNIITQLSKIPGIYVYHFKIWSFPIFQGIVNLINKKTKNIPLHSRSRSQMLFELLVNNVKNEQGNFSRFNPNDVSRALWIETDHFKNYISKDKFEKNKERKKKMLRVYYLLRAGANPIAKRSDYRFKEKIGNELYNNLHNAIPIIFFQTFNDPKKQESGFENVILYLFKIYHTQGLLNGLSESLRLALGEGMITQGNAIVFNTLIMDRLNELTQNNFGYGFGAADEYTDESEIESESDEGSFDDEYGFGASADEYDYDDY